MIEVSGSRTGYFILVRYGTGARPDCRIVGVSSCLRHLEIQDAASPIGGPARSKKPDRGSGGGGGRSPPSGFGFRVGFGISLRGGVGFGFVIGFWDWLHPSIRVGIRFGAFGIGFGIDYCKRI